MQEILLTGSLDHYRIYGHSIEPKLIQGEQ